MNMKPYISWGMFGGSSPTERANLFASWGLMDSLPSESPVTGFIRKAATLWRRMFYRRHKRC